jgi:uncharacterized protein YggE
MQHFPQQTLKPLAALLLTLTLCACGQPQADNTTTLDVTGSAEVQAVPDRFVVRAAAMQEGQDVRALSQTVNDQVTQVLALAAKLGIDKQQVQALSLQISPQWQYQPKRELTGYQVRRDLTITLKGLEHYGELLQGLVAIGINDISQTQASVSNSHELMLDALADAMKDARAKADKVAAAAGLKVDKAISIQLRDSGQPSPMPMRAMALKADSASFEPGTSSLSQQVSVTFSLR